MSYAVGDVHVASVVKPVVVERFICSHLACAAFVKSAVTLHETRTSFSSRGARFLRGIGRH